MSGNDRHSGTDSPTGLHAAELVNEADVDAVVIGAGFYGCAIAIYLARTRGLRRVWLVEREQAIMVRASYNNQARIHNGYHYPRSFVTAYRSRVNLPRFVQEWPDAVKDDFAKLYAIARNSKVTARQFRRFCEQIGATLHAPMQAHRDLFDLRLIEDLFLVQEHAFDSTKLALWAREEMDQLGVEQHLGWRVVGATPERGGVKLVLSAERDCGTGPRAVHTRFLINCTYSGLNQIGGAFGATQARAKHEITEMGLMELPEALRDIGVTVMDGPFFSLMPFPARGLHTLSHVRYTPHQHWVDTPSIDPYQRLANYSRQSHVEWMIRDASRYMPAIRDAAHVDSLWEVKTVLLKNEGDDGRPILFEPHAHLPGTYSVLGGKIDNIYDVLERLDAEPLR